MSDQNPAGLRIDIVSDVVCPWCIVGFLQLEQALKDTRTDAEIHWHPFELNPQMAQEGQNLREHLAEKYGTTPQGSIEARARLTSIGNELGFTFNFTDDMRMANTFRAHQLLHWAAGKGLQHVLKMNLLATNFTLNRNVNDNDVLADAAAEVGLDRDEALAVLEDGRFAEAVRTQQQFWTSRGIQGVPAMVFNQRHLITGAQGVENYTSIVQQLRDEEAA